MDKTFHSFEVNKSLKYPELSSIDSNLLKEINKFIIHTDIGGKEVFLITHSDDFYAFGSNHWGRLGFGHMNKVEELTIIPELSGKKVIDIKCGRTHSVALNQSGQIYRFGCSSNGRTGNGHYSNYQKPIEISVDNQTVIAIDCILTSTCVLTQSGQLYWFGNLNYNTVYRRKIVVFPSETKIKSISCGDQHILVLTEYGKVFSWGSNDFGQLGFGHIISQNSPQMIELKENIKQINCGQYHSLILTNDGKVYSMGGNSYGQLGIGNKTEQNSPQLVLSDQKEICCYEHISMSLDINNKLFVWGNILCNKEVILTPVVTGFTSFQEVIDNYAKHRSTLKPIEFLIKVENIKLREKEVQTEVNTEERNSQTIESKEQLEPTESNSNNILIKAFNNPKNSDLKFRLKSKESSEFKDIYCHKWFIKESSKFIKSLIENKMKTIGTTDPKGELSTSTELTECRKFCETIEIQINEYSYESYYQYLKSLYTDFIDSDNMEELLEILSITHQYLDSDKKNKCVKRIREKTNYENVCSVYSNAIKFKSVNLREYAFEIMAKNMTDLIETQDYENMDTKYAKQFLTEYLIRQKNDSSK